MLVSDFAGFDAQFNNEAKALLDIRNLEHPHIIQWLGAFTRDSNHCLMFPWADGGNLRDFWDEEQPLKMGVDSMRELVGEALQQFRGLTDAFVKLHMHMSYRHGDVKPENILRFKDGRTRTGTLQIADFGLAKQHNGATVERGPTTTHHTTLQYESPEAQEATMGKGAYSRLSDIWSLGCVMLEYVIWLLYGGPELNKFAYRLNGETRSANSPFFGRKAGGQAFINPEVDVWIKHMKEDPEGADDTVIGALLPIIQNYMLTAGALPINWGTIGTGPVTLKSGTRATAQQLLLLLDDIIAKSQRKGSEYLFKGAQMTELKPVRQARGPTTGFTRTIPARTATPPQQDHLLPMAAHFRQPRSTGAKNPPVPPSREEVNTVWPIWSLR